MKASFLKELQEKADGAISWVSVLLYLFMAGMSAASFYFFYGIDWVEAFPVHFLLGSLLILLVCLAVDGIPFRFEIGFFAFVFLALSVVSLHVEGKKDELSKEQVFLSDATTALWDGIQVNRKNGMDAFTVTSVRDDEFLFVVFDSYEDAKTFINKNYDDKKISDDQRNPNRLLPAIGLIRDKMDGDAIFVENYAIGLYKPYLKDKWDRNACTVLPESVGYTLKGLLYFDYMEWEAARALLEKADSLGNAMGTYHLAKWYENGCGQAPAPDMAENLYKKAADGGCRQAMSHFSQDLVSPSSGSLQRLSAERYLRQASMLGSVSSGTIIETILYAIDDLNTYYEKTQRYTDAYRFTRDILKKLPHNSIRNSWHLNNCIHNKKYEEALAIIEKGEEKGNGNCYLMHAAMLTRGLGLPKDYAKAKSLLMYAADSLDYYQSYKGLSELDREMNIDDKGFWYGLYSVEFSHKIEKR